MEGKLATVSSGLGGLNAEDWIDRLEDIALDLGEFEPLGPNCSAAFIEGGDTLLVTFEHAQTVRAGASGEPLGFDFNRTDGWSTLCFVTEAQTWFRHPAIYAYIDRLVDDGFFDAYDNVLFYGVGDCGYAAATYSVAAPGARILAIRPQATLSYKLAGWDARFRKQRRIDFEGRYGYAAEMVEGAEAAYIVFDPYARADAAHAALFARSHTHLMPFPILSATPERDLEKMELIRPMIEAAMTGNLSDRAFRDLIRARRTHLPYLRRLVGLHSERDRPELVARVCRHVLKDQERPFFRKHLNAIGGE